MLSAMRAGDADRLRIRFERAGLKTLAAPPASIRAADDAPTPGSPTPADRFAGLTEADADALMASIPSAATDRFTRLEDRLTLTLGLYRFTGDGAQLIDWAASQSGLADPLSRYTRHDLEALYQRFAANRDAHLKALAAEARSTPPREMARILDAAPKAGREMWSRLIGR